MFINIELCAFIKSFQYQYISLDGGYLKDTINEGSDKRLNEHDSTTQVLWYNCKGTGKLLYYCCMQDIIKHDKSKGKRQERNIDQ